MKVFVPLSFLWLVLSQVSLPAQETEVRDLWRQSKDPMLEIVDLENTRGELPETKWLSRDQQDLDRDINRLLEEVVEVMQISGLTEAREKYREFDRRMDRRRIEMRELREATLSADEEKSPLEFYKTTRAEYEEAIEAVEKDIAALKDQQDQEVLRMVEAYRQMGLSLSEEQVRFYLTSVSGADMMDLSALFDNVRILNTQLEELVRKSPDDPEAARRYYGIHVTLIRAMRYAHEQVLDRIDHLYLDRINELENQNNALIRETRQLIRFSEQEHLPLLESSLRTQEVTREALQLYRQHLQQVRAQVYEGQKALDQRFKVAMNAYQTIRIAATLALEMESAVRDLRALRNMHLPALVPLNNQALQQKFSEITRELEGN